MGFKIELTNSNVQLTHGTDWDRLTKTPNNKRKYHFKNTVFEQRVFIEHTANACSFENCHFKQGVIFSNPPIPANAFFNKVYSCRVRMIDCKIEKQLIITDCTFEKKVRFHDCEMEEFIPSNAIFKDLADFWATNFLNKVIFYKTDFNETAVFSMSTFNKDVLFTYSLLAGKSIFNRTTFIQGLDISQAIISGQLKLMDLKFENYNFETRYYGNNNEDYQAAIDHGKISRNKGQDDRYVEKLAIPLTNKRHTFQILKNQFEKSGNYADSTDMRREEKKALQKLTSNRKNDDDFKHTTKGDRFILWLNRWSNHYRSDFRNGIWFTLIVGIASFLLVLMSTGSFWSNIGGDFDYTTFLWTIETFVSFLNPVHKMDYIKDLNPCLGIAYVLDFLGRIFVGYGIYQTVQAFRKFK
ncbi:hypothetical protein [Nonlabens sp.]|uniref:hypothetical protein n=1 Tax=Nonlabens sp. TaxID=1888209 RepID=UPI0032678099